MYNKSKLTRDTICKIEMTNLSSEILVLKSNRPDDGNNRRPVPEEKNPSRDQAKRTHFDCWPAGERNMIEVEIFEELKCLS